jgi:hypothetical protein
MPQASNSSISQVAASSSSTLILPINYARRGFTICNFQGASGASSMYVSLGSNAASTTAFTFYLPPNAQLTVPQPLNWQGAVYAIWDGTPTGNALITEFTQ